MRNQVQHRGVAAVVFTVFVALSLLIWGLLARHDGWIEPDPPPAWRALAKPGDILEVPGRTVVYWGDPDATYSRYANRRPHKPIGIVVHHTTPKRPVSLVKYGHRPDPTRGNAAFGYHFYIARDGRILQGAPLSKRTNHVKFMTNPKRRGVAKQIWSGNAIGVSLIGACDPWRAPEPGKWFECARETITKAQLDAGLAVIRALQMRFGLDCEAVWGHGELQVDRKSFEGETLTRLARAQCELPERKPGRRGGKPPGT
jgi:N-acetylmuramoyl-L-alanine amidase